MVSVNGKKRLEECMNRRGAGRSDPTASEDFGDSTDVSGIRKAGKAGRRPVEPMLLIWRRVEISRDRSRIPCFVIVDCEPYMSSLGRMETEL